MQDVNGPLNHIYERELDVWTPTSWAGSPWSRTSQHGGPVNALFMCAAEEAAAEAGMRVARLTVDLFKPVPLEPLALATRFLRKGRRLAVIESALALPGGGDPICSARSVLLRPRAELPPSWQAPWVSPPATRDLEVQSLMPRAYREQAPPGFHWSLELCVGAGEGGPVTWITSPLDLTPDRPMSPLQRLAALSDLTFGTCTRMFPRSEPENPGSTRPVPINTDTTLHVEREPRGDWLVFVDGFLSERDGTGLAQVTIGDAEGRVGRSAQTLIANG